MKGFERETVVSVLPPTAFLAALNESKPDVRNVILTNYVEEAQHRRKLEVMDAVADRLER